MTMAAASVNVYGPMGCGKTRNAEALRRHFGLDLVVDEGAHLGAVRRIPAKGALVLTCEPRHGMKVVQFKDAMRQAGAKGH